MADYGDGFNRVNLRGQNALPFNSTRYDNPATTGEVQDLEREVLNEAGEVVSTETLNNRITGYRPYYADGSDAYANDKQFWVSIQHVPSQEYVQFKAFVTAFNETYSCDWANEHVFGRIDPIYSFKSTGRSITLNLNIPAASESEAFENLAKVGLLSDMMYPNYTSIGQAQTLAQSPMIRLKVMNLLASQRAMYDLVSGEDSSANGGFTFNNLQSGHNSNPSRGQLGVITSLSINHNLEKTDAGILEMGVNTILPKFIDISIDFKVIHEVPRGWNGTERNYKGGPYGLDMDASRSSGQVALASQIDNNNRERYNQLIAEQNAEDEADEREANQIRLANEVAQASRVFGSLGVRRTVVRQGAATLRADGYGRRDARIISRAAAGMGRHSLRSGYSTGDVYRFDYESDHEYLEAIQTWADSE